MFHARPFSLNFAASTPVAACVRVNTTKTTTIKGSTLWFVVRPPDRRTGQTVRSGTVFYI